MDEDDFLMEMDVFYFSFPKDSPFYAKMEMKWSFTS